MLTSHHLQQTHYPTVPVHDPQTDVNEETYCLHHSHRRCRYSTRCCLTQTQHAASAVPHRE